MSRAITSACGKIRIPRNASKDETSQIQEFLRKYKGKRIRHIAVGTDGIYEATGMLAENGLRSMPGSPETYDDLSHDRLIASFHEHAATSPVPRAYQWADGSAYVKHVSLVRRARDAEMPATVWTEPLMYQVGSDSCVPPRDPTVVADEARGIDVAPIRVSPVALFSAETIPSTRRLVRPVAGRRCGIEAASCQLRPATQACAPLAPAEEQDDRPAAARRSETSLVDASDVTQGRRRGLEPSEIAKG